jgi:hypothetical protein
LRQPEQAAADIRPVNPKLLLSIGDNIYGDRGYGVMRAKYVMLPAAPDYHPLLQALIT